jgi:6-phosphogluconolactonase (cycloisomerase 2 family)
MHVRLAANRWRPRIAVIVWAALGASSLSSALGAGALTPVLDPVFDADLENPWHVAVSPDLDGKYVYATSQWRGGALVVFKRNISTGKLDHLQTLKDGEDGVDRLADPQGIAVSSDGKYVYVAGCGDNAVSVFTRDFTTGRLTLLDAQQGGDTWTGLGGCFALALSPDEKNLYASGLNDNTLTVFSVGMSGTAAGKLTYLETHRNNAGGLSGFTGLRSIAVTSDGKQVLVTAESSDKLFILTRNTSNGKLTLAKAWAKGADGLTGLDAPWQVVLSSGGLNAYIACAGFGLVVLGRTNATAPFSVLEQHANGSPDNNLSGLRYLALSPDGTRLYASARDSSALSVYARDPLTGRVSRLAQVRQWFVGLRHFVWPHQVAVSPDPEGKNAYVVTGDDALHRFDLRGSGGEISWGEDSVVFGPDELDRVQGLRNAERLCMTPDGLDLYVPTGDEENLITCLRRNRSTGILMHTQTLGAYNGWYPVDCLSHVMQVIAASNGRDIYACSLGNDALVHFHRNAVNGCLTFRGAYYNTCGITNMVDPWGIALSPSPHEDHLYAAAYGSDSVVVMNIDSDGSLTFNQSFVNGTGGCERLDGPSSLCISPDGKHVYVTAKLKDAIITFTRNRTTGALTYDSYVPCSSSPTCVLVSPDSVGKHVYAISGGSSVACYSRDAATGRLTALDACEAPGAGGAGVSMAFDTTGRYLYVPFEASDTVAVFERNATTGVLTFLASKTNGSEPDQVSALAGPRSLVVDPYNNKYLYVACSRDACLRILSTGN